MGIVVGVIGAILAIFIVVIVHEFGHFIVARAMGVRVLRFSIGFGKALWSKTTKQGTEFTIGWLPLGGYVRMLGEGDDVAPDDMKQFSYHTKSVYKRMAIILAGPAMNFVLAIFLYWILFLPGVIHVKPVIGYVVPNSIAAKVGLQPRDQIIAVDSKPVKNWRAVIMAMIARMGDRHSISLTITHPLTALIRKVEIPISQWKVDQRRPQFLKALGITPYQPKFPMTVGKVMLNSPAQQGGLQQGDRVISVDGKKYDDMYVLVNLVRRHPGKLMRFRVMRNNQQKTLNVKIGSKKVNDKAVGYLGFKLVLPSWPAWMLEKESYSILTAWEPAFNQTWSLIKFNGIVLGKMISQKMSIRSLGGPVSIFQMAGKASQQNYRVYFDFLAFFSVALGFINLLPIPGLDGGHFFFQLIELVFRRPVPARIQGMCIRIGLVLLIFLILKVTFNDISRLLGH